MRRSPAAVVAVSAVTTAFGSYPGFLFGFLGPALQADLDLTRFEVGLLVGVCFGATGLGSTVGGHLAERLGARWAVTLDQLVVAAALLVAALVPDYRVLLTAAAVSGFGYALTNAGTNMAVATTLPPHRHGVALAVKTAGVPLLVAVSAVVAVGLAERFGWQLVLAGSVPILLVVAGLAAAVLPAARSADRSRSRPGPRGAEGRNVLPRGFLLFPVAAFGLVAGTQPLFSWMVPFLHEAGGVRLSTAGALTSAGSLLAVVGMVVTARVSDRAAATSRLPTIAVLCVLIAAGLGLLVAGISGGIGLLLPGLLIATVCQLSAISLLHAAVIAAAPAAVGRATGVTMSGYYLGALAGAPLFGILVDASGSYGVAWGCCVVLVLTGAACFLRCRRIGSAPTGCPVDRQPASCPDL